jgi:hypothetical protein
MPTQLPTPGRTYDLLILQAGTPTESGPRRADVFHDGVSSSVTGILKLAQRVVLEFFTEAGSMRYLPRRGCSFMTAMRQARIRTDTDIHQEFAFASSGVLRNLMAEELDSDPPDERLDTLELISYALTDGYLILNVRIRSLAGTAAVLEFPIQTSP